MKKKAKVVRRRPKTVMSLRQVRDTLPKKPSDLLDLAVLDLKAAEKAGYLIDMGSWHTPVDEWIVSGQPKKVRDKSCTVCFAGSVLACALNLDHTVEADDLTDLPKSVMDKMFALNEFREGSIEDGLERLGLKRPEMLQQSVIVADYDDDKKEFIKQMKTIATGLRAFGL